MNPAIWRSGLPLLICLHCSRPIICFVVHNNVVQLMFFLYVLTLLWFQPFFTPACSFCQIIFILLNNCILSIFIAIFVNVFIWSWSTDVIAYWGIFKLFELNRIELQHHYQYVHVSRNGTLIITHDTHINCFCCGALWKVPLQNLHFPRRIAP